MRGKRPAEEENEISVKDLSRWKRGLSSAKKTQVQNFVERCLQLYLSKEETIYTLEQVENINPDFTKIVWESMEEENEEFFKAYRVRTRIKKQIITFNSLLQQQADAMKKKTAALSTGASSSTAVPRIEENAYNDPLIILSRHGNSTIIPTCGPSTANAMINNEPGIQCIQHDISQGAFNGDYVMNNNNLNASSENYQGGDLDYNLSFSGMISSDANDAVFENEGIFENNNNENLLDNEDVLPTDIIAVNQTILNGAAFGNLQGMDQSIYPHCNHSLSGGESSNANVGIGRTILENQGVLQSINNEQRFNYGVSNVNATSNNTLKNGSSLVNQEGMDPAINLPYDHNCNHSLSGGESSNANVGIGRTILENQGVLQSINNEQRFNYGVSNVNATSNNTLKNGSSLVNQEGMDPAINPPYDHNSIGGEGLVNSDVNTRRTNFHSQGMLGQNYTNHNLPYGSSLVNQEGMDPAINPPYDHNSIGGEGLVNSDVNTRRTNFHSQGMLGQNYTNHNLPYGSSLVNQEGMDPAINPPYDHNSIGGEGLVNSDVNTRRTNFHSQGMLGQNYTNHNLPYGSSLVNQEGMDPAINPPYDHNSIGGEGLVNSDVNTRRTNYQSQGMLGQNYTNHNLPYGSSFVNQEGMDPSINLPYDHSTGGEGLVNSDVNIRTNFHNQGTLGQNYTNHNLHYDSSFVNQEGRDPAINPHYGHSIGGAELVNSDVNIRRRTNFHNRGMLGQNYANHNVMMNNQPVSLNPSTAQYSYFNQAVSLNPSTAQNNYYNNSNVLINGGSFENRQGIDQLCKFGFSNRASNFNANINLNTEAFGSGNAFQQYNFNHGRALSGGGMNANVVKMINPGNSVQYYNHHGINKTLVNWGNVNPTNCDFRGTYSHLLQQPNNNNNNNNNNNGI